MIRRYAWAALVCAAMFAGVFALTPRADWTASALAVAAVLLIMGVSITPAVRKAALRHRSMTLAGGVVLIAVAVLVLVEGSLFSPQLGTDYIVAAFTALAMAGLFLMQLPRMAANVESAVETRRTLREVGASPRDFRPLFEVRHTLADIFQRKAAFARVAGPWFLAFFAPPLAFASLGFWTRLLEQHPELAPLVALGAFILLLVAVGALLVAALQWTRCLVTDREPAWFDLSGRDLWQWLWRCLVVVGILRGVGGIEPWLRARLPAAPLAVEALAWLAVLAVLVLASPFALHLPALALGASGGSLRARIGAFGVVGRKYYVGIAVIVAPCLLMAWALEATSALRQGPAIAMTGVLAEMILLFVTVMVAMTYITRVYLKGAASLDAGAF
jgi:hypothetical protein